MQQLISADTADLSFDCSFSLKQCSQLACEKFQLFKLKIIHNFGQNRGAGQTGYGIIHNFFLMQASHIDRQTYQSDCRLLYCYFRKVFLESPNLIHLCTFLCSIVRYEPLEAAARLPTYVVHEAACVAVARIIIASLSVL